MPRPDAPPMTRVVVLRAAGFAVAIALGALAVWLIVMADSTKSMSIGVLAGIWGALIGAISMFGARRHGFDVDESQRRSLSDVPVLSAHEIAVRSHGDVERVAEAAARRAFEDRLEQMLRRELSREVADLRGEIARLRQDLLDKVGGQLRLERIETTRVIGSDLEALQHEVRQLKQASETGSLHELDLGVAARRPVVEPAKVRPVSRPAAQVAAATAKGAAVTTAQPLVRTESRPEPARASAQSTGDRPAEAPQAKAPQAGAPEGTALDVDNRQPSPTPDRPLAAPPALARAGVSWSPPSSAQPARAATAAASNGAGRSTPQTPAETTGPIWSKDPVTPVPAGAAAAPAPAANAVPQVPARSAAPSPTSSEPTRTGAPVPQERGRTSAIGGSSRSTQSWSPPPTRADAEPAPPGQRRPAGPSASADPATTARSTMATSSASPPKSVAGRHKQDDPAAGSGAPQAQPAVTAQPLAPAEPAAHTQPVAAAESVAVAEPVAFVEPSTPGEPTPSVEPTPSPAPAASPQPTHPPEQETQPRAGRPAGKPVVAGPEPRTESPSSDPFASLPRITPFTAFELEPVDTSVPVTSSSGPTGPAYTGRRRRPDAPAEDSGRHSRGAAVADTSGGRRRRADDHDDADDDLLSRLLARGAADH